MNRRMLSTAAATILALSALMLQGCSPEIGSEEWCRQLGEKPKADWTANNAADYAKHCILK